MRTVFQAVAAALLVAATSGCSTVRGSSSQDPIVSPDKVSDRPSDGSAPSIPPYTPWWAL